MAFKNQKRLALAFAALLSAGFLTPSFAQEDVEEEPQDSLVRLVKASFVNLYQKGETHYRKSIDATFLHNNTYLVCDSALWNVEKNIINAIGNVQIIQCNTALLSDRMDYYVDEDLARFRGTVVELTDRDGNMLRTSSLDYNTADSVGVFTGGGSMRSSDGQIIESYNGKYDSKTSKFEFRDRVEMFTDSVSIKTTNLLFDGNTNMATFPSRTDFWKDGNMMSAIRGWHDRDKETFFFTGNVHAMTPEQEAWCDTIYIYRSPREVELFGRVQIQDSVRNVSSLSDHLFYTDSLAKVYIDGNAAVAMELDGEGQATDTLYFAADTMFYWTLKYADISQGLKNEASGRRNALLTDAVTQYRAAAAEQEQQRIEEYKQKNAQQVASDRMRKQAEASLSSDTPPEVQTPDSPGVDEQIDSATLAQMALQAFADSVAKARSDSLAKAKLDSTKFGFLRSRGNVRIFKEDMQVKCDSLEYNDLDSIARFFINPVVWNDGVRQYTSDSLFALIRSGRMDRASLQSNAFIITRETDDYFDQITGAEVVAFFRDDSSLDRFDALGDVDMLTFLRENDVFSTANKVTARMLSASFTDGQMTMVRYFDQPKNNAYPIAQLPKTEFKRKGFNWRWEEKPQTRYDLTSINPKPSERGKYSSRIRPTFKYSKIYYPGYMEGINTIIEKMDFEKYFPTPVDTSSSPDETLQAREGGKGESEEVAESHAENAQSADSTIAAQTSNLPVQEDSTGSSQSSSLEELSEETGPADQVADTSAMLPSQADADSLHLSDSTSGALRGIISSIKQFGQKRQEAILERQKLRRTAKEEKWAVLDSLDALRRSAADLKKAERDSIADCRARQHVLKEQLRDRKVYQKYLERYRKQYLKGSQGRPSKQKSQRAREVPSDTRTQSRKYQNAV